MKIFLSSLLTLFVFITVNGQDAKLHTKRYAKEDIEAAKKAGDILVFDKKTIDLGAIKKGSFPEMTFRFLNISDENIEYKFFDVCSCSELTYDEDAVIKPGEEGSFHIVFDSKERDDEEPVEVNFELKNIDKRNGYGYFYTVEYIFKFK